MGGWNDRLGKKTEPRALEKQVLGLVTGTGCIEKKRKGTHKKQPKELLLKKKEFKTKFDLRVCVPHASNAGGKPKKLESYTGGTRCELVAVWRTENGGGETRKRWKPLRNSTWWTNTWEPWSGCKRTSQAERKGRGHQRKILGRTRWSRPGVPIAGNHL